MELYLQHEWGKRGKGSDKNKNESSYRQESARHESNQNIHSFIMVKFSLNDKEALLLVEGRWKRGDWLPDKRANSFIRYITLCMFVLQSVGVSWTMTALLRVGDGIQLSLSDRHVRPLLTVEHIHTCHLRACYKISFPFRTNGKHRCVLAAHSCRSAVLLTL